jgi:hypothetical protein
MAVSIVTGTDTLQDTRFVSGSEVVSLVESHGGGFGNRALAVTIPRLPFTISELGFDYGTGRNRGKIRFTSGTITLNLVQEVVMSSDLTECAQRCWMQHENRHVADNRTVLAGLAAELGRDRTFASYIDGTTWHRESRYNAIVRGMEDRVRATFRRMTGAAVSARDTTEEYDRVRASVRTQCGADDPAGR